MLQSPLLGSKLVVSMGDLSNSVNVASKKHYKRKGGERFPAIFVVFWRVRNPGVNGWRGCHSRGGFVVVLVVVGIVVVVVVVVEGGRILWVDLGVPEAPFEVQIGSFNGRFKQFCECRVEKTL